MTTTDALLALKVQRKVRNGIAGLAAGGASLDRQKPRPIRALRCRSMATSAHNAAEDPGSTPSGAAQTRVVSAARIRLDPRKSVRSYKGIIYGDISEIAVDTVIAVNAFF